MNRYFQKIHTIKTSTSYQTENKSGIIHNYFVILKYKLKSITKNDIVMKKIDFRMFDSLLSVADYFNTPKKCKQALIEAR